MKTTAIQLCLILVLCLSGCAASQSQIASPKSEDLSTDSAEPVAQEKFEQWAPTSLGDLSLTTKEYGKPPAGQQNTDNLHLVYAGEAQEREIDLYVVDCAENPGDMEMVDFAYAMENDGKDEKDIKPYVSQYNEEEKVTMLLYRVEDRIFVNATAVNIDAEDLWVYVQKLNVEQLLRD